MKYNSPIKKLALFQKISNSMLNCAKCPKLVASRCQVVLGYGDLKARVMFIGLAPGRNGADITGVPFTRDPSGLLFQEAMIKTGFSLESDPRIENPKLNGIYITNLVKCNPKDNNGCNRTPTGEEINNCFEYFRKEVRCVKPKLIVTLGKIVTERIVQCKIIKFIDIHNHPFRKESKIYIPFIHPSYVIRGAYERDKYINELIDIKRIL